MLDSFNVVCFDQSLYRACCTSGSPVRELVLFHASKLLVTLGFYLLLKY